MYDPSIGVKGESTPKFRRSMSTAAAQAAVKTNVDSVDTTPCAKHRVRISTSSQEAGMSETVAQARQTLRKRHRSHKPVLLTPRNRLLQVRCFTLLFMFAFVKLTANYATELLAINSMFIIYFVLRVPTPGLPLEVFPVNGRSVIHVLEL